VATTLWSGYGVDPGGSARTLAQGAARRRLRVPGGAGSRGRAGRRRGRRSYRLPRGPSQESYRAPYGDGGGLYGKPTHKDW